jgi:hypothetical protein
MRTHDHTNSKTGMLPLHGYFFYANAYGIRGSSTPSFPDDISYGNVSQLSDPDCWKGVTVHIYIPDGTSALPSWADPRHCVSNACEPFPDLVITWQRQAETFADDNDVCAVERRDATWKGLAHQLTRLMILTSFLYLDLSCRMKQWGRVVRTNDRQSSDFHPISGRFDTHSSLYATCEFHFCERHILYVWVWRALQNCAGSQVQCRHGDRIC